MKNKIGFTQTASFFVETAGFLVNVRPAHLLKNPCFASNLIRLRKSYKIVLFLGVFVLWAGITTAASAAVVINEVQIAPTDGRFIELYNTGDSDVDLTGWYIQRKTATGSSFGSLVTGPKFENKTITAGGYFLISRSALANSDIVMGDLTLTESNTIRLRDSKGADVDQVEWGNVADGKSYQRTLANGWTTGSPTPGAVNSSQGSGGASTDTSSSSDQTSSTTETTSPQSQSASASGGSSWPIEPQVFADAGPAARTVIAGADTVFLSKAWGLKKEPIESARMLWNFGDGGSKEGQSVTHRYVYPGVYTVVLEASSGYFSGSDRVEVKVVPAQLVITKVEAAVDGFIEIENKGSDEVELSNWMLRAGGTLFRIPKNTFVGAKHKIIFSEDATGFAIPKTDDAALLYPNGSIVVTYAPEQGVVPATRIPTSQKIEGTAISSVVASATSKPIEEKTLAQNETNTKEVIPVLEGQSASVMTLGGEEGAGAPPLWLWLLGVAALSLVAIAGAVLVRQKMEALAPEEALAEAPLSADDFEIIEADGEMEENNKIPF